MYWKYHWTENLFIDAIENLIIDAIENLKIFSIGGLSIIVKIIIINIISVISKKSDNRIS